MIKIVSKEEECEGEEEECDGVEEECEGEEVKVEVAARGWRTEEK